MDAFSCSHSLMGLSYTAGQVSPSAATNIYAHGNIRVGALIKLITGRGLVLSNRASVHQQS